jgi:23S rRNA pseudouridine1911/1915/1917 synthase
VTAAITFTVASDDDGERLDVVLAGVADVSRSAARRWLDAVAPTVDGRVVKRSATLVEGERVVVPQAPGPERSPTPPLPPLRHQDEHVYVVAKPSGLVVHPGAGHHGDTLVDALLESGLPLAPGTAPERPGIVHRLDRDTSGLLMIAATEAARDDLIDQLRARTVERRYLALVRGAPPASTGTVDAPIGRHPTDRQRFACIEGGRPARTHWTTMATVQVDLPDRAGRDTVSLLECRLETGRTHQIRVHLQAIGHPVLGDDRYGDTGPLAMALGVPRLALHAGTLGFRHPAEDRDVRLVEPLPEDLATVCRDAGLPIG